ncbi:SRPBCC family protein [Helcobacillus massiliensis]|uniref:SRPBCC family protein n=1 Tax=Helcobacillus massiliensis TaxID=521392 RepID=UPI0021A8C3D2|nr:SRPBCC family protein [Helcobacillus massiliensis]MCT1557942.1 SRPBCC family protein [Helcobacillus massiliensis]MCT2037341.1 SRPBCC family protein [Helcobacillus massiliensis]MCT2332944.1 SRPBCC family protein [Helcobacillus massiliensis]MDK7743125.1 SRPBCC family protein [Helcobacillus massiliensis]WOO93252.1 SRPBCC family protein [Helcobacillus massiliensis]
MTAEHSAARVPSKPFTMSYSVRVDGPADELWAIAANPHRHHELDGSSSIGTDAIGPDELRHGDVFRVRTTKFGLTYRLPMRVTESVPGRTVEFRHPLGFRWRWDFEPVPGADGVSIATETFDYSHVPSIVLRGCRRLGVFEGNEESICSSLDQLARRYA